MRLILLSCFFHTILAATFRNKNLTNSTNMTNQIQPYVKPLLHNPNDYQKTIFIIIIIIMTIIIGVLMYTNDTIKNQIKNQIQNRVNFRENKNYINPNQERQYEDEEMMSNSITNHVNVGTLKKRF